MGCREVRGCVPCCKTVQPTPSRDFTLRLAKQEAQQLSGSSNDESSRPRKRRRSAQASEASSSDEVEIVDGPSTSKRPISTISKSYSCYKYPNRQLANPKLKNPAQRDLLTLPNQPRHHPRRQHPPLQTVCSTCLPSPHLLANPQVRRLGRLPSLPTPRTPPDHQPAHRQQLQTDRSALPPPADGQGQGQASVVEDPRGRAPSHKGADKGEGEGQAEVPRQRARIPPHGVLPHAQRQTRAGAPARARAPRDGGQARVGTQAQAVSI